MIQWRRGDVVVVAFPYTEATGQVLMKGRPALIVSSRWVHAHTADVVVAAISSRIRGARSPIELVIREGTTTFRTSGLRAASVVKMATVATLPTSIVSRRIGHLDTATMRLVDRGLRQVFDLD